MKETFRYLIDILPEEDGKGYYVVIPALPGCFSQGKTVEEAKQNAKEAIALHIAELKKNGESFVHEGTGYQSIIEIAA